jgi:hypothetical protein
MAIYLLIIFAFFQTSAQRSYTKNLFQNGQLQAEGWLIKSKKCRLLVLLL